MPIKFAVTKGLYDHCQSDDLDLHSRSQVRLQLDIFLTCNISDNIQAITFKLGMTVDLWMPYAHARFDDLGLDARSQWVGKGKTSASHTRQLSKQSPLNLLQR